MIEDLLLTVSMVLAAIGVVVGVVAAVTLRLFRALRQRVRPHGRRGQASVHVPVVTPAPDIARLRAELYAGVSGSRRYLAEARDNGSPLGDAPQRQRRLESAAAVVDGRLRALAEETARHGSGAALPRLRADVDRVLDDASDLRRRVAASAAGDPKIDLTALAQHAFDHSPGRRPQ